MPVKLPVGLAAQEAPVVDGRRLASWVLSSGFAQLMLKVPAKMPPAAIWAVERSSMNIESM